MMCAIAALGAVAPVIIEEAVAVAKSYPRFFDDLTNLR
jgi:5-enolpyruvylshikimate-3-phosphate synthase